MQWLHIGTASQSQGVSWPCGEERLAVNLAFTLPQALTQVRQGLMLPDMRQLGSICLLNMFVGFFVFIFFNFIFLIPSALTLVLHRRRAQVNLSLSNFWPPWHEGICFLLGVVTCSPDGLLPWTEETLFLMSSAQAGSCCPMSPPPSPL